MRLLRNQLWVFLVFALFGIATTTSGFVISRVYFSDYAEQVALSNAVKKTLERQAFLNTFFDAARAQLIALRRAPALRDYRATRDAAELTAAFRIVAAMTPSIRRIALLDADGNPEIGVGVGAGMDVTGTSADPGSGRFCEFDEPGRYPPDQVSFLQPYLLHGTPQTGTGGVEILASILPIGSGTGSVGALAICYDFQPVLDGLFQAPLYRMILADADGNILRHHDAGYDWSRAAGQSGLAELLPQARRILDSGLYRDEELVSRRLSLPLAKPLFLILSLNEHYLDAQEQSFAEQAWIDFGLTLSLTMLLAVAIMRVLARLNVSLINSKRHATELAAKNQQIDQLITLATDGVHILDGEGNLVRCSQSFADMLGYPMEEMTRLNVADWEGSSRGDELHGMLQETLERPDIGKFETRHRRKDGTLLDVELRAHGIDVDGRRLIYASARDVSEMKRYEEHLEHEVAERTADLVAAKQLAESADRAKSRFLANMSHEMRTPMHAILSYAGLAQRKSDNEKVREYQQHIIESGNRLAATLNGLLDITVLEADNVEVRFERHDLRAIVDTQVTAHADASAAKAVDIRVSGSDTLTGELDAKLVSRLVGHLITNAIAYSPEGGQVHIELLETEAWWDDSRAPCLGVSIHDQGIGIPPADLRRIFEKFAQSSLTDDTTGGTGMGLAICDQIVQLHRGWIRAFSPVVRESMRVAQGRDVVGSTLRFEIPRDQIGSDHRVATAAALQPRTDGCQVQA